MLIDTRRNRIASAGLALLLLLTAGMQAHADFLGKGGKVDAISTDELQALMTGDASGNGVVLVDVRTKEEIAVSIIPGAISLTDFEESREQYRNAEVITYCTVGVRSGDYAATLIEDGMRARNYEGSILEWVEQGLPVVTPEGQATQRVHVYSDKYRKRVSPPYEAVTR